MVHCILLYSVILNLFCAKRWDKRWNKAWARGKSRRSKPKGFPKGFHCISWLESQYRHSQLQLEHWPSWRSILEELIFRIAPTVGHYGKILSCRLSNNGELNFKTIMFSNWEWMVYGMVLYSVMMDPFKGVLKIILFIWSYVV